MKKISPAFVVVFIVVILVSNLSQAQNFEDALRYSYINPAATARSMGFGNALGSVGGDFASLSVNPAGIGVYRRSEIIFTPSLKINSIKSDYLGQTTPENNTRFTINNIGVVFTKTPQGKRYENSAWKTVSFGIGINRLADFNRNYSYEGLNKESSYSELFSNDANNYPNDVNSNPTSLAYLGYQSYLVGEDNKGFYSLAYEATNQLRQKRYVEDRGGMNEMVFSLGGNYQEKLMLGATIGIPFLNFNRESYFQENDVSGNTSNYFSTFRYKETLKTSGIGFDLKLGAIYKPSDFIRFGAALHTPTWLALTDYYDQSLTTNTENYKQDILKIADPDPVTKVDADQIVFDYTIRTPWKAVLSATGMLGTFGFITADYEYVDYRSAKLGFTEEYRDMQTTRNNYLHSITKAASNFRIGAEGHVQNIFVRVGCGYYGSPYTQSLSGENMINISGGIGYRTEHFFADLGWVHTRFNEYQVPYSLPDIATPTAKLANNLNNIALSIGIKM